MRSQKEIEKLLREWICGLMHAAMTIYKDEEEDFEKALTVKETSKKYKAMEMVKSAMSSGSVRKVIDDMSRNRLWDYGRLEFKSPAMFKFWVDKDYRDKKKGGKRAVFIAACGLPRAMEAMTNETGKVTKVTDFWKWNRIPKEILHEESNEEIREDVEPGGRFNDRDALCIEQSCTG